MKRKLYFNNPQYIQMNSNNDIENLKQNYHDEIAKVYEINTHGKFTVIVRSSFIRLHVYPTTKIKPCYLCDTDMNINLPYRYKKRKPWKSFYGKIRKLMKEEITPTLIVHSSTIQTTHLPIIVQQEHSYYSLFIVLFVISIMIIGWILWYIFIKTSKSSKSNIRLASENDDDDDDNQYQIQRLDSSETDLNSSQTNKTVDSLVLNDNKNTNYLERKSSDNRNIKNQDKKINYENIQILIENLQQSNLESINSSVIGQIISDLIHQAVTVTNANSNLQSKTDLQTFLLYSPQFFHILKTIIMNKRSYESLNPTNFLQYQYLIDILNYLEFIIEYLHQYYLHEKIFLMKILIHLDQILASINNNSFRYQSICKSLFDIVEKLKKQKNSLRE